MSGMVVKFGWGAGAKVRQRAAGVNMSVDVEVLDEHLNICLPRADERWPRIDTITVEAGADDAPVVRCRAGTPVEGADTENLYGVAEPPAKGQVLAWVYVRPEPNYWGHHWVTDADIRRVDVT
jgi:hypothetical protein